MTRRKPIAIEPHFVAALGETTCRRIAREVMREHARAGLHHLCQANLDSVLEAQVEGLAA
jgi:hypothetical protein